MKILIIDDSQDFRILVRAYINKLHADADADADTDTDALELIEYPLESAGVPADDFTWSDYDVLLLDYNLGGQEDGFDWLQKYRHKLGFPPTIILTAQGDEYIAIKAIKLGATDYLNKTDMTPERLVTMIEKAHRQTPQSIAEQADQLSQEERLVGKISKHEFRKHSSHKQNTYKLIRKIGRGSMSAVYLAERQDGFSLALKVLDMRSPPKDASIERFVFEAQLVAELDSPFIVQIFDHGETEKYAFIAMEFFARGDLKRRLPKTSPSLAVTYMTAILNGLHEIHRVGIMHRDLKPANIMFRGDDSLALADFGISKKLNSNADNIITETGKIIGTPVYMSPEQGEGRKIDIRTDIYSAGVIFYELLTQKKPFFSIEPVALIYKHIYENVPLLPKKVRKFQRVVCTMMAKNPDDRYQTATEALVALAPFQKNS
ncbi:Serine/threonine-protein kinase PknB [uncultured Candidatus Thioglobus sp.]|nr:Serine/threonine-protein kinase PknB [uncultured Candidatus Thioglobus sp.]